MDVCDTVQDNNKAPSFYDEVTRLRHLPWHLGFSYIAFPTFALGAVAMSIGMGWLSGLVVWRSGKLGCPLCGAPEFGEGGWAVSWQVFLQEIGSSFYYTRHEGLRMLPASRELVLENKNMCTCIIFAFLWARALLAWGSREGGIFSFCHEDEEYGASRGAAWKATLWREVGSPTSNRDGAKKVL